MDRWSGRRRFAATLSFAGSALAILAVTASPAASRTFTVTRADDPVPAACQANDCSLREAVAAADGHAGADTIGFAPALAGDTITLSHGELAVRRKLTIEGPGASKLAVSGDDLSRVFHVTGGRIAISGITIKDGREAAAPTGAKCPNSSAANYAQGGAILQDDGSLSLDRVKVANSSVTGPMGAAILGGGGIAIIDGNLSVAHSRVTGNDATGGAISEGGGINNCVGSLTVKRTTARNNSVDSSAISTGGGIFSGNGSTNPGVLTVKKSTVSSNDSSSGAISSGGGIGVAGGPLTIDASTISDNRVTVHDMGSLSDGGGLYVVASEAEVTNSTIVDNIATAAGATGGGVLVSTNGASIRFTSSTIARNNADGTSSGVGGNIAGAKAAKLRNTIVAEGEGKTSPNCDGAVKSSSHDLEDRDTCGFDGKGDRPNKNPKLKRTLVNNGGPTDTLALKRNSPAIDRASKKTSPKRDQRGFRRDGKPDIGAYEFGAKP